MFYIRHLGVVLLWECQLTGQPIEQLVAQIAECIAI